MVATLQLQCKGPNQGVEHTENVLCFVSSLVGVQVRQRRCMRNIFVPRKHNRKSRKYHGNATENHGKSRKITENHGKSRKGFFRPITEIVEALFHLLEWDVYLIHLVP